MGRSRIPWTRLWKYHKNACTAVRTFATSWLLSASIGTDHQRSEYSVSCKPTKAERVAVCSSHWFRRMAHRTAMSSKGPCWADEASDPSCRPSKTTS
jgi:hypothetical protein